MVQNLSLAFIQWTEMASVQQNPTAERWDTLIGINLAKMLIK